MLTKEKARKVFFTALCVNLLVASVYSYIFIKIRQKNQHIAALTSSIEALTAQKENLKSIKINFSETASLRNQIDGYFIAKDGVVQFLNSIESLGADNNLALKIVSVGVEPAALSGDIFEVVNVSIEVSGAWSDVYRFAALLELLPLKVSVGRVDLEKVVSQLTGAAKKSGTPTPPWKGTFDIGVLKLK